MTSSPSPFTAKVATLESLNKANPKHFFNEDWEQLDSGLTCYASKYPKVGKAVSELQTQCKLPTTEETKRSLNCILSNIIKSLQTDNPYALAYAASSATNQKQRNKGTSPKLNSTLSKVVRQLHAKGYLITLSGSFSFGTMRMAGGGHKLNRLLPTSKLVTDIIDGFDLSAIPLSQDPSTGFVTVTQKRETDSYGTQATDDIPLTRFTSQGDKQTIKESNRVLTKYNQLLSRTTITLSQGTIPTGFAKRVYRRFCRSNLGDGGRLYGGFWQTLPSGKRGEIPSRKHILINGQLTVELDFKALHLNMLYAWDGEEPYQGDPYSIPGWDRELVKRCILVALNCTTGSSRAVFDAVGSDEGLKRYRPLLLKGGYDKLKQAFLQKHPSLSKYLHADKGVKLQKQDGDIALGVIERMISLPAFIHPSPIPVLSVHDSFICPAEHVETLRGCMRGAFEEVMGTKLAPVIE